MRDIGPAGLGQLGVQVYARSLDLLQGICPLGLLLGPLVPPLGLVAGQADVSEPVLLVPIEMLPVWREQRTTMDTGL